MDAMFDIETLSTKPNAVIVSAACVIFDRSIPFGGPVWQYEAALDVQDQINKGSAVDASTIAWWMGQSDDARRALTSAAVSSAQEFWTTLQSAFEMYGACTVWGNSPQFDLTILRHHAGIYKIDVPWQYSQEADMRTLKLLRPDVQRVKPAVAHSALSDAIAQASYVRDVFAGVA